MVTIHSPDKIPIRSRHALSCYCVENQIDICEFGDLKFFYNPNYTPAVEPNAMDRTTLKRLNVKRKNVDSNFTIEEPSSAKMSKINAQIVPITSVTKTFEIESTTDMTKNLEIQPTTISDVTKNVETEHTVNVAEIQSSTTKISEDFSKLVTENFENQPINEVTKNLENQPTTNVTISLSEALNEMSVEPITDELKNFEKEPSSEISEDFTNIDPESQKDYFDQESDQSENDSGLGLDPHEGNEMDKINETDLFAREKNFTFFCVI